MKKKIFLALLVTVFTLTNVYSQNGVEQNSQWDFFRNVIPKQQRITFTGGYEGSSSYYPWTMTIDDRYRVSFSGGYEQNNINFHNARLWNGTGFVIWDDDRMKIQMSINSHGFNYRKYPNSNVLTVEGSRSFNHTFVLQAEYTGGNFNGRLTLSGEKLSFTTYSPTSGAIHESTLETGTNQKVVFTPKTASELNTSLKDSFGDWTWNQDRSKISLKSLASDNKFVIWNRDGVISWSMEMGKNTKGISESTTETNDRILYFGLSFDGAPAENFSFIENKEATPPQNFIQLDYGVINCFLGTIDQKADAVLAQMKGKFILMLRYRDGNTNKTDMFLLEGLETILDNLNKT